jgi:hypothetical protein
MLTKEEILNIIKKLENEIEIIRINDNIRYPRKDSIIDYLYCSIDLLKLEYDNA